MTVWRKDNRKPANTSTQSDKTNTGRTIFYQALSIAAAKLTSFLSDIKNLPLSGEEIKEAQPANKKALSAGFRVLENLTTGRLGGSVAELHSSSQ